MSVLFGAGVVGGVPCLLAPPPLGLTLDPTEGCAAGPGRGGVDLVSCRFGPGVDGGVTCLLAAPSVGGTPRRPLKGRAMVMPWSVQTEVEYT